MLKQSSSSVSRLFWNFFHRSGCRCASGSSDGQNFNRLTQYGDQNTHYTQYLRQKRTGGETRYRQQGHHDWNTSHTRNRTVTGFGGRSHPKSPFNRSTGAEAGADLKEVNWQRLQLGPFVKNPYQAHQNVTSRSQTEIDEWLKENQCTLKGKNIPRPIFRFEESGFPDKIIENLVRNYSSPTAIQSITWPVALNGLDLISIAKTGSGKTLGFILPALVHALNQPARQGKDGPSALVLVPTRELAVQAQEMAQEYCDLMGLRTTCCYGGASRNTQYMNLRNGVDICVATPGRFLDFLNTGTVNLHHCNTLVLDEADRMLDMGFEPQIRKVVGQARPDRQTLMFSATWPKEVRMLAADFHTNPIHLNVGSLDLAANHNITQHVEVMHEYAKTHRLLELLGEIMQKEHNKTLVFVQTKRAADDLTRDMRRKGYPAFCIHGDKSQTERDWVMREFREGNTPILLATDVAARGLDVSDIKYVINYDFPLDGIESYVHRIGRTGRQDKRGTAYTFFTPSNASLAGDLIGILEEAKQEVPSQLREFVGGSSTSNNRNFRRFR